MRVGPTNTPVEGARRAEVAALPRRLGSSRFVLACFAPMWLASCGDDVDAGPECAVPSDCPLGGDCVDGSCLQLDAATLDVEGRFPADLPAGFTLIDLGEVEVLSGETPDLSFEASGEVDSFFLVGVGRAGSFVIPLSVRAPDGSEYVLPEAPSRDARQDDYFAGFAGPATSPNRAVGRPRAAAALVPNTPTLAMMPGTWTFRLGQFRMTGGVDALGLDDVNLPLDRTMRVGVVLRTQAPPDEGAVDLVLSFHASSGLDASSAAVDPVIQNALGLVDEAFADVGVRVGTVEYRDFGGELPEPLDLQGPSCLGGDVPRVFDQIEPSGGALQLVFIDRFRCEVREGVDIGQNLAAISNGVPGLPFAYRDGVVIATTLKDDYPDDWSLVLAHELGHFLGLTHTVEGNLGVYDNIADTDEENPVDYLMYPNVSESRSTRVTRDQGWVVRRHPAVRTR